MGSLLLISILSARGSEPEAELPESISIAVATDLHYPAPSLTDGGALFRKSIEHGDGKVMQYIDEITDAFLWELLESMPDYLILSGDLTFNGATESHNALISKLERLQEAGIQVLVIPGNHDVDSKYAVSFQGDSIENVGALSSAEFPKLYHSFGPEQAISQDTASFSYSIQAAKDLRIILLDANSHGIGCLKDTTLQWLKRELKDAQDSGSRVITVSHQNLYAHNGMLSNVNPHRIRILTKTAL